MQSLRTDSENPQSKRNLLHFLGDALKWLTDIATMRYTENLVAYKPIDTGTNQTTGDSSPCQFYSKHHNICSPRKQTETE